jgi:hypothetical protein
MMLVVAVIVLAGAIPGPFARLQVSAARLSVLVGPITVSASVSGSAAALAKGLLPVAGGLAR